LGIPVIKELAQPQPAKPPFKSAILEIGVGSVEVQINATGEAVEQEIGLDEKGDSALSAGRILDIIESSLHPRKSEWLFLRELRIGTGHRGHSPQRLDAFALNCLPHLAMKRACYEVKISRSDFLSEMKHPLKRRIGMRFSNEFFFVTPGGMLSLDEVPINCGLIEVGQVTSDDSKRLIRRHTEFFQVDPQNGWYCMITVPAPWRDTPGPTWQFAAAMLRNQRRTFEERPPTPPQQQKFEFT
jgi:hypothetical protein